MRYLALGIIVCLTLAGALYADPAWQQPVLLEQVDMIQYAGQGISCVNGNILLAWTQVIDNQARQCYRLYDQQMQTLWNDPFTLEYQSYIQNTAVQTGDGAFVFFARRENGIRAWKISPEGAMLWSAAGELAYELSNPQSGCNITTIHPDAGGGVYLCVRESLSNIYRIQHLNSSGQVSYPPGGLNPEAGQVSTGVSLLPMADNSVIAVYHVSQGVRVKRWDTSGLMMWTDAINLPGDNGFTALASIMGSNAVLAATNRSKQYGVYSPVV